MFLLKTVQCLRMVLAGNFVLVFYRNCILQKNYKTWYHGEGGHCIVTLLSQPCRRFDMWHSKVQFHTEHNSQMWHSKLVHFLHQRKHNSLQLCFYLYLTWWLYLYFTCIFVYIHGCIWHLTLKIGRVLHIRKYNSLQLICICIWHVVVFVFGRYLYLYIYVVIHDM